MTQPNPYVESDERKALRQAVASLATSYGHEYYLKSPRLTSPWPNCGMRRGNSASSG